MEKSVRLTLLKKAGVVALILSILGGLFLPAAARAQGMQQPDQPIKVRGLDALNTGAADFSPTLSPDGSKMLFNTRNGRYQDIYLAERKDGEWSLVRNVRELNSDYNDETPFWSKDGKLVLFASDRDGSLEMPADAQGRIRVSYDLYWARASEDGRFSAPSRVAGNFQTSDHERAPALSNDGKEIYYTTWEFGDITGSKIMVARWTGNGFAGPEPLPSTINSGNQEAALTPLEDNLFVFSSRRPGGVGGWDFYSTRKSEQGWSEPVLVPELSSPDNEMHLSIHGGDLYFASDRSGGKGHYDLYSTSSAISLSEETFASRDPEAEASPDPLDVERAPTIREGDAESYTNPTANRGREEDLEGILQNYDAAMDGSFRNETPEEYRSRIDRGLELAFEGAEDPGVRARRGESLIVQDKETGRPLSVDVKMRPYYQEEGKKRPEAMVGRSDDAGLLQLPAFDSEGLEVTISLPGYAPYHRIIDYRAVFSGKRIVYLEKARKGDSFEATAIRFDANSAVLRDESEPYLESLVEFLKKNPAFRLKIIGHTDLHGTKEYNDTLSYRRALSVRNYLVYHGVDKQRLEIEGAGFSKPVVNKKGEPFDAQNRRTEFLILQD
ncbi:MAG: PD40 domain-containing protein [Leptospiraceae bacterium]|nr:PD40 domain-containing protein [Leptospiraceae bacterium]MCB1171513.1 PD40 domain-containing protein [Leptospiraceae bacterium]